MALGLFLPGIFLGGIGILWSIVLVGAFFGMGALSVEQDPSLLLVPGVGFAAGSLAIASGILGRRQDRRGPRLLLAAGLLGTLGQAAVGAGRFGTLATLETLLVVSLIAGWWAIGPVLVGVAVLLRETSPSGPSPKTGGAEEGGEGDPEE